MQTLARDRALHFLALMQDDDVSTAGLDRVVPADVRDLLTTG